MEIVGLGLAWEDLPAGKRFRTLGRTITETDLVNFVNTTGMVEVLFTDVEYAAEHAPRGGRLVPGALVYSVAEGLVRTRNEIVNQRGETVISYSPLRLAAGRSLRDSTASHGNQ